MSTGFPQVDLVYKYIDLLDPALNREGRILKDFDNEELKYSLRSVFLNIPWVRKIFIIMPNEHVRFLSDDSDGRIVYVRDRDLLGFDSSAPITFEFNLFRLREFGCSEHIIYANDDTFFGKPINIADLFYFDDEKDEYIPYIIYNDILVDNQRKSIERKYKFADFFLKKMNIHGMLGFYYSTIRSYHFVCQLLTEGELTFPKNVLSTLHNAKPYRLSDIEKIHNLIEDNYEYADECLRATARNIYQFNPHMLMDMYFLNGENRQVTHNLSYGLTSIARADRFNFDKHLFCINTGASGDSPEIRESVHSLMERLFPQKINLEK